MAYLPELAEPQQTVLNTTTFLGYDHRPVIQDGAMYDMQNMCGDNVPLLTTRRRRGVYNRYTNPQRIAESDSNIYMIEDDHLIVLDAKATEHLNGMISISPYKQMVFMGTSLCIFPDNLYINTKKTTEAGRMGNRVELSSASCTLEMCKQDGAAYEDNAYTTSNTEPEDPSNGDLWMDTSQDTHVLKQYNEQTEEWVTVLTTYVKITCAGIGNGFKADDVVTIKGLPEDDKQIAAINGSKLIYSMGNDFLVVVGLLDKKTTLTANLTVERRIPLMDYVVECDNRLWGCRYGLNADGEFVNEIYCSKLGDFKNWYSYVGLSTDSFAATVGTDGAFTGAAVLRGSPVFFKEDCVHKVSGKIPSAFTISTTSCAGVQKHSWDSLKVINETLYYKSNTGVMAYDGSMPMSVSEALGNGRFERAVGGVLGKTYYINMLDMDGDGDWVLFTLDTETGLWHKHDNIHVTNFATINNTEYEDNLFYIDADAQTLNLIRWRTDISTQEAPFPWEAVFGTFGYEYPDQKYLSRFNIRMKLEAGSMANLAIQYDSDGVWHNHGTIRGTTTKTYMLPVIPRRCDHCQIKLYGTGGMQLYSISRVLEVGGDG